MKVWVCSVCGHVSRESAPPEKCPVCGVPKERFNQVEEAAERIHMSYGEKVAYEAQNKVNPFFGAFASIQPFIYNLPAGSRIPLHKHPTNDELFYIIRGKFKFKVGDRELVAVPGDLVKGTMNVPHTFQNIGDEPGIFLSVKGPKPITREMLE
jgi:mannose-6-phosphate isomerase-like protein (cupin superfamily)